MKKLSFRLFNFGKQINIYQPHFTTGAALLFLSSLAWLLYFSRVKRLSLSMDGFVLAYLMQTGNLLPFGMEIINEPGRPFLGLGWHLARFFWGGSVVGYNSFMFFCLFFSAVFVFFLAKTIIPSQPTLALLAGTLKLVWIANYEIFDNSGLAIYFSEMLFWAALWIFAFLAVSANRISTFERIASCSSIVVFLLILIGTYQSSWPIVLIAPFFLMWGVANFHNNSKENRWRLIFLWYTPSISMMAFSYLSSHQIINQKSASFNELYIRFLNGLWATSGDIIIKPFTPIKDYQSNWPSISVIFFVFIFTILLFWTEMQSRKGHPEKSREKFVKSLLLTGGCGFLGMIISLIPPITIHTPNYGTRVIHWSSMGIILIILLIVFSLFYLHRFIGFLGGTAISIVLFGAFAQQNLDVGEHFSKNGEVNRIFWKNLTTELPKIDEGTIVLIKGPAAGISTNDIFSTAVLRVITETNFSFFITDGQPVYDAAKGVYQITTNIDLEQEKSLGHPTTRFRYPRRLDNPQTYEISENRVVWLNWNTDRHELITVVERSSMSRIHREVPSTFGQLLFPMPIIN